MAAHTTSEELALMTNNECAFKRVSGLRVRNWAIDDEPQAFIIKNPVMATFVWVLLLWESIEGCVNNEIKRNARAEHRHIHDPEKQSIKKTGIESRAFLRRKSLMRFTKLLLKMGLRI